MEQKFATSNSLSDDQWELVLEEDRQQNYSQNIDEITEVETNSVEDEEPPNNFNDDDLYNFIQEE